MKALKRLLERVDRVQQAHMWLAVPFAVVKKYGDDRGGNLAALIAYYGFLSIFPLLLVLVTVLGIFLSGNPHLRASIETSALAQFPVIGTQLQHNVGAISGSGLALAVGIVGSLWGGLGVMQAAQTGFAEVWDVPIRERGNFLQSKVRGILMLVVVGAFLLASTVVSGAGTTLSSAGPLVRVLEIVLTVVLNLALYLIAFRVLTPRDVSWRDVLPGAVAGALLWTGLQFAGSYVMQRQVSHSTQLYGFFGLVLGLLFWVYLGAQITMYAAELNVVIRDRLWPRSLTSPPLEEADERVLTRKAESEERVPEESVTVSIDADVRERPAESH
jgi:YihY family inner membrane protein